MKKAILANIAVVMLAAVSLAQRQIETIAELSLTNQTGITGGTLYTPKVTRLFRVSFYVQCTGAGENAQGLYPQLTYTDDIGPDFAPIPGASDGRPSQAVSWTGVIKSQAGTPIMWQVQVAPGDTSKYEVYMLLERIGPHVR